MPRVVSLLASATEIVCALQAGEMLVGRSHECDNPGWVGRLPACSEPAFDVSVSSGAIDAEVRRRLRAGEPLYRIHLEKIRALQPDLVITQSHCEVCAVTPADLQRIEAETGVCAIDARQLALSSSTLEEIFGGMLQVAQAIGLGDDGRALVESERRRLETVRDRTRHLRRPSVVMLEWTDPLFAMGNWGPELVDCAGGELLLGRQGEFSAAIPAAALLDADPEHVIVAPCGFDLERAMRELAVLERLPGWRELRAVRNGNLTFADGNRFFNRSGMTAVQTAEIVAEILHGVSFGAPSEGGHWTRNRLATSLA